MTRRQKFMLAARLAMPAILAQLSSIMMQYIDASMVGRLGTGPSASVGLMSSSLWLFWGICSMATMGFSVQVAHCLGAREHEKARSVLRQGFTSVGIFSVLMALLGVAIAPSLPHWLGGDESVAADATLYFTVFVAALPMLTLNYICGGMLRCAGQMKVPSLLNVLMCLLDIVFNFFLIFPTRELILFGSPVVVPGAGLGVLGAALGTVFAEVVVAVLMCYYLCWRQDGLNIARYARGSFRPTMAVLSKALRIALPMTLEHAIFCGAQIMITIIVAPLGAVAIAANAFAVTAESLCYMPGFGIGDAATTLTGQSFGARRFDLVKSFTHISVGMGMAVMTFMAVILYVCAPLMMELMTPVREIASLGTEVLRIQAWAEPMYAASIVTYGAFVGVGDTLWPAVMNFGSIWLVRIPVAAILAPAVGLAGVWIAMAVELTFRGMIFLWRLWSGAWLRNRSAA
ncbi:MAG: MATE family efflux transporter [Muribaculaceae bacterium]|nr:MATE family efflux transporter [Muribaculaceae bacterium]